MLKRLRQVFEEFGEGGGRSVGGKAVETRGGGLPERLRIRGLGVLHLGQETTESPVRWLVGYDRSKNVGFGIDIPGTAIA